MNKPLKSPLEIEAIVAEYLLGGLTYRQLGKKCNVDFRIIHSWVMKFQGKNKSTQKKAPIESPNGIVKVSKEFLLLQEELRKEKLRNELLNAMIDIAENDLKISIRKKSGTKQ
jgi:transposase-like protein